ncbi:MAG: catalase, partial [Alteromonadaceae bacterium]|nr:catalase [Alteromonadaceae bacterium]
MSNNSNSFEEIADLTKEQNDIKQLADITQELLDKRYASQNKNVLRGVHPKSHGCVKAKFKINQNIATKYQVGLFSIPDKEYEALIRFSNATSVVGHDLDNKENLSRGMAIKVLDVAGDEPFLQNDQGARNQDFLMINTASFAFVDIPDYLQLNKILLENNDDPSAFFAPLVDPATCPAGVISSFKVVKEIESKPVENPLGVQYFGAAPFLFGPDNVMRFSVIPCNGVKPQQVSLDATENYLNDALISDMEKQEEISFDFMVQVRDKGETDLGIEDATKRWDEQDFPFISIAKVTIYAPQSDLDSVESEADCENLIFTPWHSLVSHQPLGGINRLRQDVYNRSSTHRGADDPGAICRFARRHDHSEFKGGNSITDLPHS